MLGRCSTVCDDYCLFVKVRTSRTIKKKVLEESLFKQNHRVCCARVPFLIFCRTFEPAPFSLPRDRCVIYRDYHQPMLPSSQSIHLSNPLFFILFFPCIDPQSFVLHLRFPDDVDCTEDSNGRTVVLTPAGTVVVGSKAAEAFAKAHQARVTSDQKVGVHTDSTLLHQES